MHIHINITHSLREEYLFYCFYFFFFFILLLQYKIDCRVTIELLDTDNEDVAEREKPVNKVKTWSKYVERLSNPASGNTTNANSPNANNNNNNNSNTSNMDTSNNLANNEIKSERWDEDGLVSSILY